MDKEGENNGGIFFFFLKIIMGELKMIIIR